VVINSISTPRPKSRGVFHAQIVTELANTAMPDIEMLLEKARRFATALDACDYTAAAQFLAPNCRYVVSSDEIRVGPESICASYRENDERARREFDEVKYSSAPCAVDEGGIRLTFSDELQYGGATHTFRCSQMVYLGVDGKIDRIELQEIPGERDRLKKFCESRGISPN
jgi:hypothetical protein